MDRTVYNIPRYVARDGKIPHRDSFISLDNKELLEQAVWISISEPNEPDTVVSGPFDQLPNIKLAFWDLIRSVEHKGQVLRPPPESDARKIVNFLLKHKNDKNIVIVNCAAGVSRSGAIAQFCSDYLDYKWDAFCKSNSAPNSVLYRLMVNYYQYLLENENIKNNQLST